MIYNRKIITDKHKEDILSLFYRTELRENEDLIDNRSITISKELDIALPIINEFLSKHLEEKFLIIDK